MVDDNYEMIKKAGYLSPPYPIVPSCHPAKHNDTMPSVVPTIICLVVFCLYLYSCLLSYLLSSCVLFVFYLIFCLVGFCPFHLILLWSTETPLYMFTVY